MNYNTKNVKEHILTTLNKEEIKHEVHNFESGSSMIDIWLNNKFYVIQLESESIGFSLIDDENPGFDTIPDERFFEFEKFIKRFESVLFNRD